MIENTLYRILWWLEKVILGMVDMVEGVMRIFTGEKSVTYDTKESTLIDVFFNHESVRGVYTAVAIIGIIFAFAFATIAVIRKIGDFREKQQGVTMGTIVGNLLKSVLLIVGMNAIMVLAIGTSNILVTSISRAFTNYKSYVNDNNKIKFTDEHYAAMARIINTLGNYSLNPSYRSRYNLNACYNDIRTDLQYLGDQGVLSFHYVTKDAENKEEITWQSIMEKLGTAYDYTKEATLDSYDDGLTNALLDCIEILRANTRLKVLEEYERDVKVIMQSADQDSVPMDRILFLIGTMGTFGDNGAARNDAFNKNPSFFDSVRQPFYTGAKSLYKWEDVKTAFDPSPTKMNYILVYAISIGMLMEMLVIILTCAVRIFNLLALYIAAPLAISSMPLDDGGKFKQWITAFIVQLLSVVGMVLSMRLLLVFLPIIWSPALKIVSTDSVLGTVLDCIVKAVITYGGMTGVNKVNGIFTGILADNAGYQAILAGDVRDKVQSSGVGQMLKAASAGNVGKAVASKVSGAVGGGAKNLASKWGGKAAEATGLATLGRSIRGAAESIGIVKEHDKSKDPEHVQHARERARLRDMNSLKADVDYGTAHGTHRDGTEFKPGELRRMQHTLNHMENGNHTLSQAKRLAEVDMKQDVLDADREGRELARELPNNQRRNQPANQNNQPVNQNNQPANRNNQPANRNNQPVNRNNQPVNRNPLPPNQNRRPANQNNQPINNQPANNQPVNNPPGNNPPGNNPPGNH